MENGIEVKPPPLFNLKIKIMGREELLKKLGFTHIRSVYCEHPTLGVVKLGDNPEEWVEEIYNSAQTQCKNEIKTALGIPVKYAYYE